MRALAVVAFATLLLSATVSGALLRPGAMPKDTPRHEDAEAARKVYELAERLFWSAEVGNYTHMATLLSEDFTAQVTPASCGLINKAQFLDMWHQTGLLSETITIRGWIETSTVGLFELDVVGQFDATRNNMSAARQGVYVFITPTADFKQVAFFQQLEDLSYKQANATAMVNVLHTLSNASINNDIAPWEAALAPVSQFLLFKPWSIEPPQMFNRSETIATLKDAFTLFSKKAGYTTRIFAACDMVFAESDVAAIGAKTGRGYTNHYYVRVRLDSSLRVVSLGQLPTRPLF